MWLKYGPLAAGNSGLQTKQNKTHDDTISKISETSLANYTLISLEWVTNGCLVEFEQTQMDLHRHTLVAG